jgi:hypothetical protein
MTALQAMQQHTMFWRMLSKTHGLFQTLSHARIWNTRSSVFKRLFINVTLEVAPRNKLSSAGQEIEVGRQSHPLAIRWPWNCDQTNSHSMYKMCWGTTLLEPHVRVAYNPVAVLTPIFWSHVPYLQFLPLTPPLHLKIYKNYLVTPLRQSAMWLTQKLYNYWNKSLPKADWKK